MERLGDDARRLLRAAGMPDGGLLARVTEAWPAIAGDAIARAAWPRRLARDGTLHVATASSTWAFELDRLRDELLERLRAALGEDAPPALRFAPGPLPSAGPPEDAGGPSREAPRPGPRERAQAASLAAAADDPELRELIARAAAASLAGRPDDRPVW